MDIIWDRKSFEVGGQCRCGGVEKWMTTQNQQKSKAKKEYTDDI